MAGVKITDLPEIVGSAADSDVLVLVDVSENSTKKIPVSNLLSISEANSAQTAQQVAVSTTTTNTSFFMTFVENDNGSEPIKVDDGVTYNPVSNTLSASFFSGDGSSITGVLADSAASSASALFATEASNSATADSATVAASALFATEAGNAATADSATVSASALFATEAGNAATADSATVAATALFALNTATAAAADSAALATLALFAFAAGNAATADSAATAATSLFATEAGNAATADSATTAATALFATIANESLGDLDNIIDSAGGNTVLGELTVDSDLIVRGVLRGDGSGLQNVTSTAITLTSLETDAKVLDSTGTHYLMLRTLQTGYDSVSTSSNLTFSPNTGTLSATGFSGDGTNVSNVNAATATVATNVTVTTTSADAVHYPLIASASSGNDNPQVDVGFTFNPATNKLSTSIFSTGNWEMFESANELFFAYNGTKKMKIDSAGNVFMTGTLSQGASL